MTGEEFECWQMAQEAYESGRRDGQGEIVRYIVMFLAVVVFLIAVAVAWGWWG